MLHHSQEAFDRAGKSSYPTRKFSELWDGHPALTANGATSQIKQTLSKLVSCSQLNPLVLGSSSVHTNLASLKQDMVMIQEIGHNCDRQGEFVQKQPTSLAKG